MIKLNTLLNAHKYYTEKFDLKQFTPAGALALQNWLYQQNQTSCYLPVTSEIRYLFCTASKHGTQAIAARLIIRIQMPFSIAMQESGLPTDFNHKQIELVARIYIRTVGKGLILPQTPSNDWWTPSKIYLQKFTPFNEKFISQLFFSEHCLSSDYVDKNWEAILENSQSTFDTP